MIRKFIRWLRGLLPSKRLPSVQAEHPDLFGGRVMHLAGAGFVPACGARREPFTFMTVELAQVNCHPCLTSGKRRAMLRSVRLR